ncbi:tetratricopeptide repeat protein [Polaribacter sp.]|uniref:tetratricopeptide repeat protein n=1 Tax=Polaribacter sp. TaxID=1920175 RepID=UPI0040481FBF
MNFKKIISELKRRNVFKVATAYAITGWLIIQIVTSIKQPLSLPNWFDTITIIFVFIGFPISLIFAWAFELTPDGLKKTETVKLEESKTSDTGKRLNRIIIGILTILIAFLVFDRIFYDHSDNENNSNLSKFPSIAVLPFADMSPEKDQEYFSDGLSEELLNVLAKRKDLKVAGRTSSFKFKGQNDDIKLIGKELGVEHILEGSVRKSGDKIRITAQLIKVADGFHMWSETYDRDYTASDLFKIQDEISKHVLNQLKITLLNDTASSEKLTITKNTKAYEAYLKGNQLLVNRNAKEIEKAIESYKTAIKLDKNFAEAYAGLAISYRHLINYGSFDKTEGIKNIIYNASRALLLDNTLGIAYASLGHYYAQIGDFDMSSLAHKKAYELTPSNAEIVMWYASSLNLNEKKEVVYKLYKEAYEKDPLSPIVIQNLVFSYKLNNELEKAMNLAKENVRLNPNYMPGRIELINFLKDEPNGKLDEAFKETFKLYKEFPSDLEVLSSLAMQAEDLKLYELSDSLNAQMKNDYPKSLQTEYQSFLKSQRSLDVKNTKKSLRDFFIKSTSSDLSTQEDKILQDIFLLTTEENYQATFNELVKIYPQITTDTITVITNEQQKFYPEAITILQKIGKTKIAERLIPILEKSYALNYEFGGNYKKEPKSNLWKIRNIAIIKKDYKLIAEMDSYLYFERKDKSNTNNNFINDIILDLDINNKYLQKVRQRIEEDKAKMKANVIFYLKQEGTLKN